MSNSLAIATVTASLRKILENAFNSLTDEDDQIANATVTTLPPDDPGVPLPPNGRGANIFLYLTTPNAAMRNTDLPTRNANGDLMARPRVALDLTICFLFTATRRISSRSGYWRSRSARCIRSRSLAAR